jgi:glucose/arabinose dehydrogenase
MNRFFAAFLVLSGLASPVRAASVGPAFPSLPAFDLPVAIAAPNDGSDRLFVSERAGRIHVFDNDPGVSSRSLFLDIADSVTTQSEGGLLGLAFHPNHASNRHLYVVYTIENPRRTVLSRFTASAGNRDVCNPNSELRVIELPQVYLHHKGGCLQFDGDGMLCVSFGDGGQGESSQDLTRLEGKLLRIDVDSPGGGRAYGIPPDNPLAGNAQGWREEIVAWGFRNPWRFGIDVPTGRIWLGDVGQQTWEEINVVLPGRNYGWPRMEGEDCYSPPSCDTTGLDIVMPLVAYPHGSSASVTGGRVYRGPSQPDLFGKYIYSDFIQGDILAIEWHGTGEPVVTPAINGPSPGSIVSFGVDANDELYMASFDGVIYRFEGTTTGVGANRAPPRGRIVSAYPSPFSSRTTLSVFLPAPARATVSVYDVRGMRVATLARRDFPAGSHAIDWDGRDTAGHDVPAGVYFCQLQVGGQPAAARRIVRVR